MIQSRRKSEELRSKGFTEKEIEVTYGIRYLLIQHHQDRFWHLSGQLTTLAKIAVLCRTYPNKVRGNLDLLECFAEVLWIDKKPRDTLLEELVIARDVYPNLSLKRILDRLLCEWVESDLKRTWVIYQNTLYEQAL